jgi:hypothetical protein
MTVKYYTHFVLTEPGRRRASSRAETVREYSGIIELNRALSPGRNADEVAAILARDLDLDARRVKVIDCSRLH